MNTPCRLDVNCPICMNRKMIQLQESEITHVTSYEAQLLTTSRCVNCGGYFHLNISADILPTSQDHPYRIRSYVLLHSLICFRCKEETDTIYHIYDRVRADLYHPAPNLCFLCYNNFMQNLYSGRTPPSIAVPTTRTTINKEKMDASKEPLGTHEDSDGRIWYAKGKKDIVTIDFSYLLTHNPLAPEDVDTSFIIGYSVDSITNLPTIIIP